MNKITTSLAGSSNAVLIDHMSKVIAIIKCPAKKDITNKIISAIKSTDSKLDTVTLNKTFSASNAVLNNQEKLSMEFKTISSNGELNYPIFEMYVVSTIK